MKRNIVRARKANEDIADIWEYIAFENENSGSEKAANEVSDAIDQTINSLLDFPHRHKLPHRDVFKIPVVGFPQYLVFYKFDRKTIEILRVFRASLDWTRIF